MANPSDILQYRDLLNQLVLDSQTMAELGRVETLWMYPQRNRVLGVVCRPRRFGSGRLVFKLTQMQGGQNSLLMTGDPEPTVAAKVQQLESLIGQEVWSDRGERVGKIVDCLFNPENGVILRYLLVSSPWASITDGTYLLSPKRIISFSAKRTLISADAADSLEGYEPGLRQRLAQIREMLKEDYVDSVARELQTLSSQMQSQLQTMAQKAQGQVEQAQGQMETLLQRTRERAKTFSEEFSQEAQGVMHQIQTEAQAVTQRVEQASETFGFPLSDIETRDDGEKTIDLGEEADWGVWPDTDGDGPGDAAEVTSSEQDASPDLPRPQAPKGDRPQEPDTGETPQTGPIIVPAAAHPQPEPPPVDGDTSNSHADPKDAEARQADSSPSASDIGDDSFEGWPQASPDLGPDGTPESAPQSPLEPDERDIWDDWEENISIEGSTHSAAVSGTPDGAAKPAQDEQSEKSESPADFPKTPPEEDDPWI